MNELKGKIKVLRRIMKFVVNGYSPYNLLKISRFLYRKKMKIIFLIAPSDLNTITKRVLNSNKTQSIKEFLEKQGYDCIYLIRRHTSSSEDLPSPLKVSRRNLIEVKPSITKAISHIVKHRNKPAGQYLQNQFQMESLEQNLRRIKPHAIFTIGVTQEVLKITNDQSIKTIEVMHGTFNEVGIPSDWLSTTGLKPDLFLSWDDTYTEMLNRREINARTLGYPNTNFRQKKEIESNKYLKILVTLSHSTKESIDGFGSMSPELFKQLKTLRMSDLKLVFRLHPVVDTNKRLKKEIKTWLNSNFPNSVIESSVETDLHSSMSAANLHLTHDSSTYLEAGLLKVPTILTSVVSKKSIPSAFLEKNIVIQGGSLTVDEIVGIIMTEYVEAGSVMTHESLIKSLRDYVDVRE